MMQFKLWSLIVILGLSSVTVACDAGTESESEVEETEQQPAQEQEEGDDEENDDDES